MNKKLLALAVAGAFALPVAAMADTGNVSIYGLLGVSYDLVDNGNGTVLRGGAGGAANGNRTNKVSSNASRIGFKGAEDMGGGLSAVWQVESTVDFDGAGQAGKNANTFATRNTYLGLKGNDWGTVLLGQYDTPYKVATRRLDVFVDTIADNRSLMGMGVAAAFDQRPANTINYTSNAMSGFTVAAAYVASAETMTGSGDTKGQQWSLAGMYDAGPLYATVAYETHDANATAAQLATPLRAAKEKAWKLGAGYTMDAFTVNAVYEKTSDDFAAGGGVASTTGCGTLSTSTDCAGHSAWYLAGKFAVGANDSVKLAYTKMNNLGTVATSNGAKQWAIGYDHSFSKRTWVYALYTKLDNDTDGAAALSAAAAATGNQAAAGFNADPTAWSFGLKHSF